MGTVEEIAEAIRRLPPSELEAFRAWFAEFEAELWDCEMEAGVRRVVDVRLNNTSQIAGFAKARDLEFFLRAIAGMAYLHLPELAPTQEILDDFVKAKGVRGSNNA